MANPQCENGYTRIANEILEALSKIRIPGEARRLSIYNLANSPKYFFLFELVDFQGVMHYRPSQPTFSCNILNPDSLSSLSKTSPLSISSPILASGYLMSSSPTFPNLYAMILPIDSSVNSFFVI